MKKQFIVIIAVVTLLAAVACVFAACDGKADLSSPRNLNVVNNTVVWDAVKGADGYLIYFNEDIGNRFYTTDTKLSLDNGNIQSSLISGEKNYMMVRAITLDKESKPEKMSDRSKIIFPYSRKLATPNKLKRKDDTFSFRGVIGAEDYKALVRKDNSTEYVKYDFAWKVGTTGVNATIVDLPNGSMYYVSVIAVGAGYEDSDPTEEIPYDKTALPADYEPETGEDDPVVDNSGKWAVTFDLNYEGSTPFVVYAENNKPVATPATRTRSGYVFDGWYEDVYTLIPAGFTSRQSKFNITCNTTLYAKWVVDATYVEPTEPDDPDNPQPPVEPVNPGEVDSVRDAYLYVDGTDISWFASTGATISAKITYADGSVNSLTSEKAKFINGLYRWGVNGSKSIKSAVVSRVNVYGTTENVFELPMGQTPTFDAKTTSVFKLTTLNNNACSGKWVNLNDTQTPDDGGDEKVAYIYFDTTAIEWWDDAGAVTNVHIWYEDGSNNTWPGAVMTKDGETKLYSAKYYPERGVKGIIFTRNDPTAVPEPGVSTEWGRVDVSDIVFNSQKPVYRLAAYNDYYVEGKWTALNETYEPEEAVWLNIDYSNANVSWFGDADAKIYVHVWYTDSTSGTTYPGDVASKQGKTAAIKIDASKKLAGFVVTRCDPSKPFGEDAVWNKFEVSGFDWDAVSDIDLDNGKNTCVYILYDSDGNGKWEDEADDPSQPVVPDPSDETFTVYFKNGDWKYVYAYAWSGDGESAVPYLGTWPGTAMKASTKAGWYEITVNAKAEKIVFNDTVNEIDGGNKTADLTLDKTKPYYNGSWSATADESTPVVGETVTIYYFNSDNWAVVKAYAWTDSTEYLGAWSGTVMSAVSGKSGWFEIYVDNKAENVIFADNSGNQTENLVINYSKPYYNNGWVANMDTEVEAPKTVKLYYYNSDNWTSVKAYAWSGDGDSAVNYLGTWPGTAMSAVSGKSGWFEIEVSEKATKIVFNNDDNGEQTSDLTINSAKPYYKGAWLASMDETVVKPASYTVYYYNSDNWSVVNAYAWYGDGSTDAQKVLGSWGGTAMTSDGDGWYKIDVPSSATKIIFNNGSNQTDDLTIDPDNLYFKNGAWAATK